MSEVHAARFDCLVHADWSVHPRGRWLASAHRTEGRWVAEGPAPVPALDRFVAQLLDAGARDAVLAGFDFPIGLPVLYGANTGLAGFQAALARFGAGEWAQVYDVAATPAEVGVGRPFYPARGGGARRQHLLDGHGVRDIDALTRCCERGGGGQRAAGCLFWTLGAKQVGKAAITGWRDVVRPAVTAGAAIWPFDGDLAALAARGGLTLAETYPADAYAAVGAAFKPRESKRRQADRIQKADAVLRWAEAARVALSPGLAGAIRDGFGREDRGGDRFDAVIGLFGMIGAVDGVRPAEAPTDKAVRCWEGWILGRKAGA